ncbi:hypothetical protein NAEGRDRAFT_74967 [Naegleria gruberi]|uniref:F-box domain-containing protein n=1 Tax=Naegleria gruberi TaxID=5762 RepID=D2W0S9_NAEGR|nr:uncharacterized protein NAEGRDRAFT_74967 [Naegleria gruberi]EFC37390.1 hypothetical protein NAEGRDRAFT_74967 [Naegleria gruberi]|eukprot:XP_002670134.1 hypothetical protein NAEGRDRAFT_74967 [Naegleria gruberi strain NEG-M]
MNQLHQLPTEVLDHIIFYMGNSAKDVISFSSCCKVLREELLESNPLVLALKVSSDIRKLGNINCRRMKALKKKQSFQKPKDQNILKEYKRKFDELNSENDELNSENEELETCSTTQITKAFRLTSTYGRENFIQESREYAFEKWLTVEIETKIDQSKKSSTLKTNAIKETDGIKRMWSRLMNEYFLFQCGEEVCEIISKCVYQKVEYTSWNVREEVDSYPRFYAYDGVFNIASNVFTFFSSENESK